MNHPAYYEGTCDYCDQPISPGDYVVPDDEGRLIHQEHGKEERCVEMVVDGITARVRLSGEPDDLDRVAFTELIRAVRKTMEEGPDEQA